MLSEAQLAHLEHIVHSISAELHIEEATLDDQQTLALVLCNDTTCFRPLHITVQEVDVAAALAGQPGAQHALEEWLRSALQDLVYSNSNFGSQDVSNWGSCLGVGLESSLVSSFSPLIMKSIK
jgi:hypothetical protein